MSIFVILTAGPGSVDYYRILSAPPQILEVKRSKGGV